MAVYCNTHRVVKSCGAADTVIRAGAPAQAGNRAHHSSWANLPDRVVGGIRHVNITGSVNGRAIGMREPRVDPDAIIGAGTAGQAGNRAYQPIGAR